MKSFLDTWLDTFSSKMKQQTIEGKRIAMQNRQRFKLLFQFFIANGEDSIYHYIMNTRAIPRKGKSEAEAW